MKLFIRLVLPLSILLLICSCNESKKITKENTQWSLELKLAGCMDVCKSYSIILHSNASYQYKGRFNAKHLGEKSGKLNEADMLLLNKQVNTINWETLKQSYGKEGSGPQRKELNYKSTTIDKQIIYFSLEALEIRDLENLIDKIISHDDF